MTLDRSRRMNDKSKSDSSLEDSSSASEADAPSKQTTSRFGVHSVGPPSDLNIPPTVNTARRRSSVYPQLLNPKVHTAHFIVFKCWSGWTFQALERGTSMTATLHIENNEPHLSLNHYLTKEKTPNIDHYRQSIDVGKAFWLAKNDWASLRSDWKAILYYQYNLFITLCRVFEIGFYRFVDLPRWARVSKAINNK